VWAPARIFKFVYANEACLDIVESGIDHVGDFACRRSARDFATAAGLAGGWRSVTATGRGSLFASRRVASWLTAVAGRGTFGAGFASVLVDEPDPEVVGLGDEG
jgi:hypothetical protein